MIMLKSTHYRIVEDYDRRITGLKNIIDSLVDITNKWETRYSNCVQSRRMLEDVIEEINRPKEVR